jgi:hypothetical protein
MYEARLTKIDEAQMVTAPEKSGDDPPVVHWPKPTIKRIDLGDRTVIQMGISRELLAELDASDKVELQIVPIDALE